MSDRRETPWQYDAETAVAAGGTDCWTTRLNPAWNIGDNPNGGYASASALRALGRVTGRPDPISVTTHYLRPGLGGADAEIRTELIRTGRRAAVAEASLRQDGRERLRTLAAFADLGASREDHESSPGLTIPRAELPPPEECRSRLTLEQGVDLPIASRVDVRIHPALADAGQAGRAEIAGWIRFHDGRPPDSAALVLFADAFPPSVFGLLGQVGWVPTLELTVHVRRRPAAGWIAARFRTRDLVNGLMVEDGELWDETGALVARSRQLALLLPR